MVKRSKQTKHFMDTDSLCNRPTRRAFAHMDKFLPYSCKKKKKSETICFHKSSSYVHASKLLHERAFICRGESYILLSFTGHYPHKLTYPSTNQLSLSSIFVFSLAVYNNIPLLAWQQQPSPPYGNISTTPSTRKSSRGTTGRVHVDLKLR